MSSHPPHSTLHQKQKATFPPIADWQMILSRFAGSAELAEFPVEKLPVIDLGAGYQLFLARWILPVASPAIDMGFVLTKDHHIQVVAPVTQLPSDYQAQLSHLITAVSEQNILLTPGLINCHTHLEQSVGSVGMMPDTTIPRVINQALNPLPPGGGGLGWGGSFSNSWNGGITNPDMAAWLIGIKPKIDRLNTDEKYQAEILSHGLAEVIATGTTCLNDISRQGASLDALDQAKLRGIVSLEFFHPNTESLNEAILHPVLQRYLNLANTYAAHPLLSVGLSPHSPYNVSPIAWRWMLAQIQNHQNNVPIIHTHLAESIAESAYLSGIQPPENKQSIQDVHQAYIGKTFSVTSPASSPVQYLANHHLLTENLIAAHGVYVDKTDCQLLKQSNVHIAHCPRSNAYLQGKTIDYNLYQSSGIALGLGTDGHLSTPSLDLRAEARVARIYHGLNAQSTIQLITIEAAKVLNLADKIGQLTPAYEADFVYWQISPKDIKLSPEEQLLSPPTQHLASWVQAKKIQINSLH